MRECLLIKIVPSFSSSSSFLPPQSRFFFFFLFLYLTLLFTITLTSSLLHTLPSSSSPPLPLHCHPLLTFPSSHSPTIHSPSSLPHQQHYHHHHHPSPTPPLTHNASHNSRSLRECVVTREIICFTLAVVVVACCCSCCVLLLCGRRGWGWVG